MRKTQTPKESGPVSYKVETTVKVDGVELAPGSYKGKRTRLGIPQPRGTVWGAWEYTINTKDWSGLDCTPHVGKAIKIVR
jgi:hypothetical protein